MLKVMYLTFKQTLLVQVILKIFDVVIVGTAYEGGIFRCKLVVDSEFPQKPPKGKT
jgi:ubiquitin-protein ligase